MTEQPDDYGSEYVKKWGLPIHGPADTEKCQEFGKIFAAIFGVEFARDMLPSGWLEERNKIQRGRLDMPEVKVIVFDNVVKWTLRMLEDNRDRDVVDDVVEVKVCLGRSPDEVLFIVYGYPSRIHQQMLQEAMPLGGSGGGDTLFVYEKDGAIAVDLANISSTSLGPLRSEFRDTVVAEFKKLIAQLNNQS